MTGVLKDDEIVDSPASLEEILRSSAAIGFKLASARQTGALLRTLAASKPGGRLLELGTGTGVGTAWLLDGMDSQATLDTVDNDKSVVAIARRHLGGDPRVTFHPVTGEEFLTRIGTAQFDLVFADAWPGKYTHLDAALEALRPGGMYVIDDLLPQPNWPDGHAHRIPPLVEQLERREGFVAVKLAWASGLMIVVRRPNGHR